MRKLIKPEELNENVFSLIGKEWMLVLAGNADKANAMTASWGGLGVMWGKNVAYVVIRPQRYTKEFIDVDEHFTLNFFGEEKRDVLNYMGTVSGRTENKMSKCGLKTKLVDGVPAFEESRLVMVCRKMFAQPFEEKNFIDTDVIEKWYPEKDYHTLYIAEIEKVYIAV